MRVRDVLLFAVFALFVFMVMTAFVYIPAEAKKKRFQACSA